MPHTEDVSVNLLTNFSEVTKIQVHFVMVKQEREEEPFFLKEKKAKELYCDKIYIKLQTHFVMEKQSEQKSFTVTKQQAEGKTPSAFLRSKTHSLGVSVGATLTKSPKNARSFSFCCRNASERKSSKFAPIKTLSKKAYTSKSSCGNGERESEIEKAI